MNEVNISKQYCKCHNCGEDAIVDTSVVLTTYPAQYYYTCPHCGHTGTTICDNTFCKIDTSTLLDTNHAVVRNFPKIEKLDINWKSSDLEGILRLLDYKLSEVIDAVNKLGEYHE